MVVLVYLFVFREKHRGVKLMSRARNGPMDSGASGGTYFSLESAGACSL